MELSYWEYKTWLANTDYVIVGSGIVGLSCALQLRSRFPKAKICILEKGSLPEGASTKNAGFACFGSISEVLADLNSHSEEAVLELIKKRWDGIANLTSMIPEKAMNFRRLGGHEVFLESEKELFEACMDALPRLNTLLKSIFPDPPFVCSPNRFKFQKVVPHYITHNFEAQLDPALMIKALLRKARDLDITIINGVTVKDFTETAEGVAVRTDQFDFNTAFLAIATNGYAGALIDVPLSPARAQVLLTHPIPELFIEGTFHLHKGYFYFRNVDNRILLGGGRHLDFQGETTDQFGQTHAIQAKLEELLREVILPGYNFSIDQRWSGIMGVGNKKTPIIRMLGQRTGCAVRLGGMGVAIGSLVGAELADLFN